MIITIIGGSASGKSGIAEDMICRLAGDKNKYYIDILEEAIIAQDKKAQAEYLGTLIDKAIITPNEARKQLGYAPMEGGDDLYRPFTDINQNKINQDKNTEEQENDDV